uniref:Mothers against decapentaplegic homolog n=1 Tax=Homalodisca liturata TaxID=320908 RepID=A0A1B6HX09_9HEMI
MFMFRSKRTALAKRLWKARIRRENEAGGEAERDDVNENRDPRDFANADERSLRTKLLKRLKESQLETLAFAVENGESSMSTCVMLPKDLVEEPHLKCCQTWRWPDLRQPQELKQLPLCDSIKDPAYICCNPYHWSRICKPESPPPPYQRFARERLKPEDRAPSEGGFGGNQLELRGSLTTEDEPCGVEWCRLAYWELSRRVGRQYKVFTAAINVFWNVPQGTGLCLETLAGHSFSPPDAVRRARDTPDAVLRARDKIGRGLTLSLEADGVWAYNRSEAPIFVNSPTLDDPDSKTHLVYRVPPGHCLNIFVPGAPRRTWDPQPPTGPVDRDSVRISFAKGWGPKYSRQEVTACPTWLEVLLAPCR